MESALEGFHCTIAHAVHDATYEDLKPVPSKMNKNENQNQFFSKVHINRNP